MDPSKDLSVHYAALMSSVMPVIRQVLADMEAARLKAAMIALGSDTLTPELAVAILRDIAAYRNLARAMEQRALKEQ